MSPSTTATLIGDLVASKQHRDRQGLQQALVGVLDEANRVLEPAQPLAVTVGDEFQGCFLTPAAAIRASLVVRLMLLADERGGDSRYGLGFGAVQIFDAGQTPVSQDGPGWWSARTAIERAQTLASAPRSAFVRTAFSAWVGDDGAPALGAGESAALEAFLLTRDALVAQMSARGQRLLLGLLSGLTQAEMGEREGVTQGAVSQHLTRSGAFAIDAAQRRLEGRVA